MHHGASRPGLRAAQTPVDGNQPHLAQWPDSLRLCSSRAWPGNRRNAIPLSSIGQVIWESKYRFSPEEGKGDQCIDDSWRRVALAVAAVEPEPAQWQSKFFDVMAGLHFLPGGRILAGA